MGGPPKVGTHALFGNKHTGVATWGVPPNVESHVLLQAALLEGSAIAAYQWQAYQGWLPQHWPNAKQHPEKVARDADESLHEKVTTVPHTGDAEDVIPEEMAEAADKIP